LTFGFLLNSKVVGIKGELTKLMVSKIDFCTIVRAITGKSVGKYIRLFFRN